jgi:hypothetical protein
MPKLAPIPKETPKFFGPNFRPTILFSGGGGRFAGCQWQCVMSKKGNECGEQNPLKMCLLPTKKKFIISPLKCVREYNGMGRNWGGGGMVAFPHE